MTGVRQFFKNESGQVAVTFALAAVPLVALSSAALDYSQLTRERNAISNGLDAAVLAAANNNAIVDSEKHRYAEAHFLANYSGDLDLELTPSITPDRVRLAATGVLNLSLGKVVGIDDPVITEASAASLKSENTICVLSLSEEADAAISFDKDLTFVASNCSVHANSTSDTAVLSQANITVKPTAASFCAVGGVSGEVEPHSKGECGAVSDPYKHVASAPIGACKREFLLENSFINTPENTSPNSPSSGPETELPSTNPKTVDEVIKALQLSRDDKMIGTNRGPIDEQRVTLEKIAQLSGEDMSRLIDAYGPYGEYMECFENPQPACEGFNNPFLETPFNEVPSISLVAEIFEISYGEFVDDTEEMDVPEIVETGLVELINGELYSRNNVDNELVPISANLTGGDILLTPGTYCGGLTVDGLRVRFSPGDYIFKDGPLTFLNQSQAEADKVTFGFRGSGATLNIESGSKLKIRSAISGPRSGLAFMNMIDSSTPGNRAPVKEINRISSGGSVSMSGTAYFPQQTLMISGENTNVGANSPAVGLIADKIAFRGQTGSRVEIGVDHVAAGIPPIQPRAEDGVRLTE